MTKIANYMQERWTEKSNKDYGYKGKCFELAAREFLTGRHQKAVRPQGKIDFYYTYYDENGKKKQGKGELKTACGDISNIEKRNNIIVYTPEVDETQEAEDQSFVFTREEWINFINGYPGKGKFLKTGSGVNGNEIHIQSFRSPTRPKASKPIADYIWNACFEQPTLTEWKESISEIKMASE